MPAGLTYPGIRFDLGRIDQIDAPYFSVIETYLRETRAQRPVRTILCER